MPFYVEYCVKKRAVKLNSVSPPQFIICYTVGADITLEAVINDQTNLRNHTFEWVQIKGTPVTLSAPNSLITTYEFGDSQDKVFRFYIDRGTANEQYLDARIYHTPTSFIGTGQSLKGYMGSRVIDITNREDISKTAGYTRTINGNVPSIPAERFTLDIVYSNDLTPYLSKLEVFYSNNALVEPTTLIDEYQVGSFPTQYEAETGYYRFALTVDLPNQSKTYYSDVQFSKPVIIDSGSNVSDELVPNFSQSINTLNLMRFEIIGRNYSNNFQNSARINTVGLVRFDPITVVAPNWNLYSTGFGQTLNAAAITRLDPSGVGSG